MHQLLIIIDLLFVTKLDELNLCPSISMAVSFGHICIK